jgi:cell division protein ZapD
MTASQSIIYEFPCTEKIRMCMRLERTMSRMRYFMEQQDERAAMVAMAILFELIDLTTRPDLRKDLIQELQRMKQKLSGSDCPACFDAPQHELFLAQIDLALSALLDPDPTMRSPQSLRDNDWLSTVRTRSQIPGGCCGFDLPSLQFWLSRPFEVRHEQFRKWLRGMTPIKLAIDCILDVLRSSVAVQHCEAKAGNFNLPVPGAINWAIVQIALPPESTHIPEVSVNKFMLWIHFLDSSERMKTPPSRDDFEFDLGICGI